MVASTERKKDFGAVMVAAVATAVVMLVILIRGASAAEVSLADIDDPFGLPTVVLSEDSSWATWRELQTQIDRKSASLLNVVQNRTLALHRLRFAS
jgi:hypothetical protein